MFTPLHIEILIWYHTRVEKMPNHDAPAVIDYTASLVNLGILYESISDSTGYKITPKGHVWLKAILSTPLPIQHWIVPAQPEVTQTL